jgi:serine/threonine-protein kinase
VSARDLLSGTPYRTLRLLGEGGMGEVYEIEHELVGKRMVAKILRAEYAEDVGLVDRLRVEAQALAALSHPNVVNVTDFSRTADGRPFYVMEMLNGRTLGDELRQRGAIPVAEGIEIARQALRALGAAHQLGLVHRDIKLDNLYLHTLPSGERVVKVLDFGVTKVLAGKTAGGPAPPALPTADGAVVGTPRYVSPEQVRGKTVDHRADLYAVSLLLYTLIAGRGPFDHLRSAEDLLIAHLTDTPEPPSRYAAQSIPTELDGAILCALAKDPDQRFQSAASFEAALGAIADRWAAPIGWLDTALSPVPVASVQRTTVRLPDSAATVRDGMPAFDDGSPLDHTVRHDAIGDLTSYDGAVAGVATPTEFLKQPTPPLGAVLPTRTAAPYEAPRAAAPIDATAMRDAAPNTTDAPAPGRAAYAAAALVAIVVSVIGLWITQARSVVGLAVVLVGCIAAAAATAWIVARMSR